MNWWATTGISYAVLATLELGWLAWDYNRKSKSPQVDVTGDALGDESRFVSESPYSLRGESPRGLRNAPSPFDSPPLTGSPNHQARGA